MAKKKDNKKPAENIPDEELQNVVIALLDSGDDTGCEGTVVVSVEQFRKVQELIKDRTGNEHGSLDDGNIYNDPNDERYGNEDEEDEDEDDDFDDFGDDEDDEDDDDFHDDEEIFGRDD